LPYVVVEIGGKIGGYAYAGPYRARPAYRYAVEDSVYVAPDCAGKGAGRLALSTVIDRCTQAGFRQMVAVIGDSGNEASIALHERLGFRRAGVLTAVGFKLGRWVDSVLMQRALGPGDKSLPEPVRRR
jgi:L-amino acid N-acyltransferase YncA